MSPVDRGRCLVLAVIAITLLGGLGFGVLPAANESIPFFTGAILAFCAVARLQRDIDNLLEYRNI